MQCINPAVGWGPFTFANVKRSNVSRCPTLWMEAAMMELQRGNVGAARKQFAAGAACDPPHHPLLEAWAALEREQGNAGKAAELTARANAVQAEQFAQPPADT